MRLAGPAADGVAGKRAPGDGDLSRCGSLSGIRGARQASARQPGALRSPGALQEVSHAGVEHDGFELNRCECSDHLAQQAAGLSHMTNFSRWSWLRTISQRVVPANAGTHHPWPQKRKKGLCSSAETRVRAAAMSAIALTLGS